MDPNTVTKEIQKIIESGESRHYVARDKVSTATINTLLDVLGDNNPIYSDRQTAQEYGYRDVIAPPAALQVWTMNLLNEQLQESPVDRAYQLLAAHGFPNVVAVNSEQHYTHPIYPGDRIASEEKVETLSELKQTGLGPGMFITTLMTFCNQDNQTVGTMRFRTLWYSTEEVLSDEEKKGLPKS